MPENGCHKKLPSRVRLTAPAFYVMALGSTLLAGLSIIMPSASAQAQEFEDDLNSGMQTGTRFARAPKAAGASEARWMQKRVANCMFNRNKDEARELLANSDFYRIDFDAIDQDPEEFFDDYDLGTCMGRLVRGADNRTYHMQMQMQFATLRNLMAEEAYLQDFDGPPAITAETQQDIAERFDGYRPHPQVATMAAMTDCMTYHAPADAHELLRSRPGSNTEQEVIDRLGPVVVACANTDEAELSIPTSLIRQMAADGLWTRSHYGSAS